MKNVKGFTLGLVMGLSIAIAGIAFAQSNTQTGANQKHDACCCLSASGDSCPMMKNGVLKEGAMKSDGHGCCCCGGDSCNMKGMKHMEMKEMKETKEKP